MKQKRERWTLRKRRENKEKKKTCKVRIGKEETCKGEEESVQGKVKERKE